MAPWRRCAARIAWYAAAIARKSTPELEPWTPWVGAHPPVAWMHERCTRALRTPKRVRPCEPTRDPFFSHNSQIVALLAPTERRFGKIIFARAQSAPSFLHGVAGGSRSHASPFSPQESQRCQTVAHAPPPWVTVLLLSNLGTFVIRIRILCIVHVSCMYFACILMCPVHIHQDTSRYIKIHLYLSLWLS